MPDYDQKISIAPHAKLPYNSQVMANILHAVLLGAVQGITEFLPISSSGHLIVLPWFLHFAPPGLAFDVLLHLATAFALLTYFWKDIINIFISAVQSIKEKRIATPEQLLPWLIVINCIPAAIAGVFFEDTIENIFRNPAIVGFCLVFFSLVFIIAEKAGKKNISLKKISWRTALIIGLAQVLALIPGTSRAGITMTAGLFCSLDRESAARFSFLLATPLMFGAGIFKLKDLVIDPQGTSLLFLITGFITAVATGFLSIKFLLNFLKKHSFYSFIWYRIFLGTIILIITLK